MFKEIKGVRKCLKTFMDNNSMHILHNIISLIIVVVTKKLIEKN